MHARDWNEPHHVPSNDELREMSDHFDALEDAEWWQRQDAAFVRRHVDAIEATGDDGTG